MYSNEDFERFYFKYQSEELLMVSPYSLSV